MTRFSLKSLLLLTLPLWLLVFSIAGCYLDIYLLSHNYTARPFMI